MEKYNKFVGGPSPTNASQSVKQAGDSYVNDAS
jgi:hypothetical protein